MSTCDDGRIGMGLAAVFDETEFEPRAQQSFGNGSLLYLALGRKVVYGLAEQQRQQHVNKTK